MPSRWLRMSRPEPPNFTTAPKTRSRSARSSGFNFDSWLVNIARKWALRLPKSGKQTALPSSHTRLAALKCFSWAKMSGTPRRFADQLEHHRRGNNLHTQSFESAAAQRDRAHRLPRLGRGEDASEVERSRRLYRAYSGNGGLGGALVAGKACRIVVSPLTRLPFMRLSRVIRILPLLLAIAASYRAALGEGAPDYLPPSCVRQVLQKRSGERRWKEGSFFLLL